MKDDLISRRVLLEELKEFTMSITGSAKAMVLMVTDETKRSIMRNNQRFMIMRKL